VAIKVRERIVENLAVGLALGFLTLIVVALSLFADSRSVAAEIQALTPDTTSTIALGRIDDPSFDRIYEIRGASGLSYGVVLSFRSPDDSAIVGAIFSPRGELRGLRFLGACASRLPEDVKDALVNFVGADEALNRAADAVRNAARAANGASETKS
jgi:hypothetical protein